jgi:hypothetical protein
MRLQGAARGAWIEALAGAYEGAKRAAERGGAVRAAGTWYTPDGLVRWILDEAMPARPRRGFRAVDPACGTGNFLLAIARRLRAAGVPAAQVARAVHGMDLDPMAVAIARVRMEVQVGGGGAAWRTAIRSGDALGAGAWKGGWTADLVAGNPPFLGQLSAATARGGDARAALRDRFGGVLTRYADQAAAFLLLGSELAGARGVVAMVQPVSVLAATDAEPVRAACMRGGALAAVLFPASGAFGAAVHTCVPILRRGRRPGAVQASTPDGRAIRVPTIRGSAWSAALAAVRGVPDAGAARAHGTIGDHARATADFRQHYYGLRGRVREAAGAGLHSDEHALVTVGAIDAATCAWGRVPVRLHGRAYDAPVVRAADLAGDAILGPWLEARRGRKILVATQTRAIEAVVDTAGRFLPSTPVITVMPRRATALWRVGAALLAPSTAALAWQRHGGAALSPGALRVSARQLMELPAPGDAPAWARGATALRAWQRAPESADAATRFATAMCDAYGVPAGARAGLVDWWLRAATRRPAHGGAR